MDLRRLEHFLAVADHGTVTAAALALHVAQPALSQSIKSLERDLGVELFERRGRRLALTPDGKALLDPARRVLADLAAARAAVAGVIGLSAGRLDVAVHDGLAAGLAGPLAAFHRRHSAVPVRVHTGRDEDEIVRYVVDGRCELGIGYLPVRHPGLAVRELGTQELLLALPPGVAEADEPQVRCGHPDAVVPLVLAGGGPTLVSARQAVAAERGGATIRKDHMRPFGLLHRPGQLSPAARRLTRIIYGPDGIRSLSS